MTSAPLPSAPPRTSKPAMRGTCLALVAASLVLGGCGYKGDLVLADPAEQGAETQTGDQDADAKPSAQED